MLLRNTLEYIRNIIELLSLRILLQFRGDRDELKQRWIKTTTTI